MMMMTMMMMPDASKLATGPESCTISPFFFLFWGLSEMG